MSDKELAFRRQCFDDFEFYAAHCLYIKHKIEAALRPFFLNDAQKIVLADRNRQLKENGFVRQIILKGRQQGISTLIEGIGFHKVTHTRNVDAFILTHLADATDTIFNMVKRFHENCPDQMLPKLTNDSNKQLTFGDMDSGYGVGTAGSKGVGRSKNLNFFHGSEVAFWQNASEHAAGVMNAVLSEGQGTEVYLESTANGMGNYYHTQWQKALNGEGGYSAVFVPWFMQSEYNVKKLPEDWTRTSEEDAMVQAYGLRDTQLAWRRNKIVELSESGVMGSTIFMQEYPCYPNEAFQMTGEQGLIQPEDIMKARKNVGIKPHGPVVMGIDPSRGGPDRFAIAVRQGRVQLALESKVGTEVKSLGQRIAFCKNMIDEHQPDYIFIDAGSAEDLIDRLKEVTRSRITPIYFGGSAIKDENYVNKRAEMYGELAVWLRQDDQLVSIVDSNPLHADLAAVLWDTDSNSRLLILKKEQIKKKLGFSPDLSDSLALTFAEPVIHFNQGRRIVRPKIVGNI